MKKALLLLLAVILMSVTCLAGADSLEVVPGSPSNCQILLFKTYFDLLTSSSGYNFTWNDTTTAEDGYTVHTAVSETGILTIKVYVKDNCVCFATGEGTTTLSMYDSSAAQTFGEWFGISIGGLVVGMYAGENGPSSLTNAVTSQFATELNPLVEVLNSGFTSEEELANGIAGTTTILGYPTGLEVSGSVNGTNITLTLGIATVNADGQLNIIK